MAKCKYNTGSFVAKAREVHGDKYDYSKTEYLGYYIKSIIICKKHGVFEQLPVSHMLGKGCLQCARENRKLTIEEFIIRARRVHGYAYDYSMIKWNDYEKPIEIICKEHGLFQQIPSVHCNGFGCKKCSGYLINNTEEFIEKAVSIHDNKYDYSQVNYINASKKVSIICKIHGIFKQIPSDHIRNKSGCFRCAGIKVINTEDFIKEANIIHNNKYDYSKVNYEKTNKKVEIICKEHGSFFMTPNSHLTTKHGCKKCAGYLINNTKDFIEQSIIKWGSKYTYEKTIYVGSKCKIIITCKEHGDFTQTPTNHMKYEGCIKCINISNIELKWLDEMNIPSKYRHFTLRINDKRYCVDGFDPASNTVYEFYGDFWHGNPTIFDKSIMNYRSKMTFGELYQRTINRENILKQAGYHIVYVWENDYRKYHLLTSLHDLKPNSYDGKKRSE